MKNKKWIWIAGALLLACMALTGCGSSDAFHLEDYIEVSFSGVNGKGSVELSFDGSEMDDAIAEKGVAKYGGELAFLKEYYEKVGSSVHEADTTPLLIADQSEYLKNGDVIHIACKYDEDNNIDGLLDLVDERYVYEEMEVTVDGLQDVQNETTTDANDQAEYSQTQYSQAQYSQAQEKQVQDSQVQESQTQEDQAQEGQTQENQVQDSRAQDGQAQEIAELNTYAENELTAQLGRCEKGPFSCAIRGMGPTVDGRMASHYYSHMLRTDAVEGQAGVITWKSADFDGDGSPELLVLTLKSEQEVAEESATTNDGQIFEEAVITNDHLYLQMYRKTDAEIVLADEYEAFPDVLGHYMITDEEVISLKEANGKLYVYGDLLQGDDRFGYPTKTTYFLLAFKDGKWEEMTRFEGYSSRNNNDFERERITADMELLSSIGLNKTAAGLSQMMDGAEKEVAYKEQDSNWDAFCAEYPLKRPSADETETSDFLRITGTSTYPEEETIDGLYSIRGHMNYTITTYE